MTRDRADRGLDHATSEAQDAVRGIVKDGPVAFVNAERARLRAAIGHADHRAQEWANAVHVLADLRARHETEREELETAAIAAEQHATRTRTEVTAPLIVAAAGDATLYQEAVAETREAIRTHDQAGWLRKRTTARDLEAAQEHLHGVEGQLRARWGSLPPERTDTGTWADTVADRRATEDDRVTDAEHAADDAHTAARRHILNSHDQRARVFEQLYARIEGRTTQPHGSAASHRDRWQARADTLRETLDKLEALPPTAAVKLLRSRQETARRQGERFRERARQLGSTEPPASSPERAGPDQGLHR
jgi:hypothetical protein